MNWDWDKLQEKRRHQPNHGNAGKGKKVDEDKPRNDDYKDNFHDNDSSNNNNQEQNPFNFANRNRNNNGGDGGGNNRIPFGKGQDPREMLEKVNMPGVKWVVLILLGIWLATGIFIVRPDEAGVVLRFGAYNRTVDAGMHYHLPYPFESVALPKVTQVRQIVVGQSPSGSISSASFRGNIPTNDEASMLTGDENIVNIQFIIQYYVKPDGVVDYLYKVALPDNVVKKAAEAAMREVIGKTLLDNALTVGRNQIQTSVEELLQSILDSYEVGIQVVAVQMQDVQPPVPVRDAFKDVASAREDKERLTNEARAYRSDILPKAQGLAAEKINQAEAYLQARVRNAEGEATRFTAILEEYNKAQDVTKKRLLMETMEEIFANPNLDKVILPKGVGDQVLPFLPLSPSNLGASLNTQESNSNINNVKMTNNPTQTSQSMQLLDNTLQSRATSTRGAR